MARRFGRIRRSVLAALLAIGSGAVAMAAEGEGHEAGAEAGGHDAGAHHASFDGKTFAFQLINFAALVFVLAKFGGGAINKALKTRHDQMKIDLEEASRAKTDAEKRLAEQEGRLASLEKEVGALRASLREEADREKAKLVAAAEERAKRIQDETRFLLDQQVKQAEQMFRDEVATAAVKVAEEVVRRSLQADDESRLLQGFVADLERSPQSSSERSA